MIDPKQAYLAFPCRIRVEIERRHRYYRIDLHYADLTREQFRITGRNGSVVLENNRPLLRGKGLKHFRISWKVVEGEVRVRSALEPFIKAILARLEPLDGSAG